MMDFITGDVKITPIYNDGNSTMGSIVVPNSISTVISIFTVLLLLIKMTSLGCTMEISKIKAHLLKPKGVFIALLAQFLIMPLTAFSLTKILRMNPMKSITVLICGCCPGGSLSNIFSHILKGDMNLSIVMTSCSSIAALGLMPLLLYIFSQGFSAVKDAVPYVGIIRALMFTLVPCGIGIVINHYKPNYSKTIIKVGNYILIISFIVIVVFSGIALKDVMWMILMPDLITAAALMPLIGFIMGYVMAAIWRLSPKCSRTISMETGCQNIQLCTAILQVAFTPETVGPLFLFPLLYITFQCAEALLLILCFRCYKRITAPDGDSQDAFNPEDSEDLTSLSPSSSSSSPSSSSSSSSSPAPASSPHSAN